MLEDVAEEINKISGEFHKQKVEHFAFFISLLSEELGQVSQKYMHEGRNAHNLEIDICDIIVVSIAALNWLGKDISQAMLNAIEKHRATIEKLK
jgi:NTP pyrophosphatase (non-canonical NTP hydrolase)